METHAPYIYVYAPYRQFTKKCQKIYQKMTTHPRSEGNQGQVTFLVNTQL